MWDAHSGRLRHPPLSVHTAPAHVVVGHPSDPGSAMSCGYDGQTVLWDVQRGEALKRCVCVCVGGP